MADDKHLRPIVLHEILDAMKRGPRPAVGVVAAPSHREDEQAKREFAIHRRLDMLSRARETIPASFRWAHFGPELDKRVDPPSAIAGARELGPVSIVIAGPSGSGKTSLACALLREVIHAASRAAKLEHLSAEDRTAFRIGMGARFMSAWRIAKAQIYNPLGKMPPLLEDAIGCAVLVLDDLGMDYEVYRASASAVREVLHERHAEHKRTIVTTYLRKPDIEKHYGAGIARRLGEWHPITLGPRGA